MRYSAFFSCARPLARLFRQSGLVYQLAFKAPESIMRKLYRKGAASTLASIKECKDAADSATALDRKLEKLHHEVQSIKLSHRTNADSEWVSLLVCESGSIPRRPWGCLRRAAALESAWYCRGRRVGGNQPCRSGDGEQSRKEPENDVRTRTIVSDTEPSNKQKDSAY